MVVNGEPPMQVCRLEKFLMRRRTMMRKERSLRLGLQAFQPGAIMMLTTTTTIIMIEVGDAATDLEHMGVVGGSAMAAMMALAVVDHITVEIAEGDPPRPPPHRQVLALRVPLPRIQMALQNSGRSTKISLA